VASSYAAALHSFSRPFKVAYPTRTEKRSGLWLDSVKAHWTKITLAVAIGMFAGFIAGVVTSRAGLLFTQVVYAAAPAPAPNIVAVKPAVPTADKPLAQDEVTRLRAQNEQLQTMLAELKKTPAAHARRAKAHHRRRTHARA
jgi:hypothetical protein